MKKILILGGTGFVGRLLTERLIKTDYNITLFNRGKTNPGVFPGVNQMKGDRNTDDILKIVNSDWDALVDFTGYFPDNIEMIADLLEGKVGRYIFISTGNAYSLEQMEKLNAPIDESVETEKCTPEQRIDKDPMNYYGNKKAECERILLSLDWLDTIIFRPSLIYGRYDPTDRFYYWLYRAKKLDTFLLPEGGKALFTNTFSEDFAKIIQESINLEKHREVYNASTHTPLSIKEFIYKACNLLNSSPEILNAPVEFLEKYKVTQWQDIAIWISDFDMLFDNSRLKEDFNTKLYSFEESLERTIEYYAALGWKLPRYGLSLDKEKMLIGNLTN